MADPALNANTKVARRHESQQKFGFKFLVTQVMGYLTGGPQRYTGRPMEEAHKHLAISSGTLSSTTPRVSSSVSDWTVRPNRSCSRLSQDFSPNVSLCLANLYQLTLVVRSHKRRCRC